MRLHLPRPVHHSAGLLSLLVAFASIAACTLEPEVVRRSRPQKTSPATDDGADEDDTTPGSQKGDTKPGPGGTSDPSKPPAGGETAPPGGAEIKSTKGTGGPTGQNELKSAGGLSYIINVPATAPAKPRGLLVLLHGSTASNYKTFVGMMATVASKYDLIRVSILAPNGQGWNEGNQQNAAELLHRAIQEDIFAKYDIDLARVYFSGQSSGGGFLSSHFLPLHAKDYHGGAFMQCGAAPPFQTFTPDAATKQGMRLHFEITTGDTIWPTSYANAVTAYTNAGMSLSKDNTKPGGHCAFDQQQVILDRIGPMLPPGS